MNSKYFKSKRLKPLSERPEHIRLDAEAVIEDVKNQLFDYMGRATDEQIQDICNVFAGGKPNQKQTKLQRMFECSVKEMKMTGRFINE
tara:strand:+ start:58 stop:321 length:264 start_codon:yes stop_codon:yes gene_type:complete